jgi:Fic family protein
MDWRKFGFDYRVDEDDASSAALIAELISIEAYKEAALNLVLPADWREQLDKLNRVRAIHGTTALEGNPLSEAEVSQQIENPRTEDSKATKEQLQIRNAESAQAWVRSRFVPKSKPLDIEDVLTIHKMITDRSDTTNNIPGEFRTFPVVVGSEDMGGVHRGAPYEDVPKLMQEYIRFMASRKLMSQHCVIRALLAHFFLVTIHPFGDGNGRVSRLVEAGILFQGGYNVFGFYGLSNYFYRNEREYKTLLQQCRAQQPFNVSVFLRFGVAGFAAELKGINNFIKTKLNRVVYRTMLVESYNKRTGPRRRLLNQREYNLLIFLLRETEPIDPFSDVPSRKIALDELDNSHYIQTLYKGVTHRTFIRELIRLRNMGFIGFTEDEALKDWIVELDFGAISRHSMSRTTQ